MDGQEQSDIKEIKRLLLEEGAERDRRLTRLERFVKLPPEGTEGAETATISQVIRQTNRETIAEALTWRNISKVAAVVSGIFVGLLQIVNLLIRTFS